MAKKPTADNLPKTVEDVARDIRKQIPGVRIHRASDPEAQPKIQKFGIPEIDEMCRGTLCGGYSILWGPEKSGKSSLLARSIAQMQQDGRTVLLVDLENRMDPSWMQRQGVDLDKLILQQGGQDLESNLNAVNALVRNGVVQGVAVDSLSAKAPRGEVQDKAGQLRGIEEDTVALVARKLSQWFRIFTTLASDQKVPVILLSQTRTTNINAGAYQDMSGGRAVKHWGSTTLKIGRGDPITATKDGKKAMLGFWMRIKLDKTSLCSNEGKEILLPFYFGIGIDDIASTVRAAIQDRIVTLGVRGVSFQGKNYASENKLVEEARTNTELAKTIADAVKAQHAQPPEEETAESAGVSPDAVADENPDEDITDPTPELDTTVVEDTVKKILNTDSKKEEHVCQDCGQILPTSRGLVIHTSRIHGSKKSKKK